jgi:ribosomal-protein-alanine N-acetyltransferase
MPDSASDLQWLVETPRLRLRQFRDSDADFYRELLNDPGFIQNIADRGINSDVAALASLRERVYGSYQVNGFGMYLVEDKQLGRAVGMAGLVRRDFLPHVDVGYAFLPVGRGRGLATEAAAALLVYARDTFQLERIAAITALGNNPSIAVLLRLGFVACGHITLPDTGEQCACFERDLQTFSAPAGTAEQGS